MSQEAVRRRIVAMRAPLAPGAIHVWRTSLSSLAPLAEELRAVLTEDETARAEKFRFPDLRRRFIAGRALLRMVLGDYCGSAPEDLRFVYGENQKPALTRNDGLARTVSFNLSHSADAMQIAVTAEAPVGVDVECLEREHDLDALLAECLTEEERGRFACLSGEQRQFHFLRNWVHKEAFLKCAGCGFAIAPKQVQVTFVENGRSTMRCSDGVTDMVLFGFDLPSQPGYIAALASTNREATVQPFVL